MSNPNLDSLRQTIRENKFVDEHTIVEQLLQSHPLDEESRGLVESYALTLVENCRADTDGQSLLDTFLQEYGLSNQEGVALMCLAESLLRVPDAITADRLIAEKIENGNWLSHTGESDSWLVNASTWGLVLTGKLVNLDVHIQNDAESWLKTLSTKLTAPVIRAAVLQAMKLMGGQYVLGRTINEGIKRGTKQASTTEARFSFDMLGEAARTPEDAQRYFQSYSDAFDAVGDLNESNSVIQAHGVSVKLSALHPQYHFAHQDVVMRELLPMITSLAIKAKKYNIGLSIDAEEAARLDISLDVFQALCENPELDHWRGLGFVMQAYQKRAPYLANWLVKLAQDTDRTIMVRLVKGAYWDAEIKLAQEQGFTDYPVYTRKQHTDVCYLHCAEILLNAKGHIFPQFATHNAHTAVAVRTLASQLGNEDFEFQRLHGMGELLYKHLATTGNSNIDKPAPLRVYAPIGQHRDLLPYLVRRLLENGANSSFVNQFLDPDVSAASLTKDCFEETRINAPYRHSQIPLPSDLFIGESGKRINASGFDLDASLTVKEIENAIAKTTKSTWKGHSIINGKKPKTSTLKHLSSNPSNLSQPIGEFVCLDEKDIRDALESAHQATASWSKVGSEHRVKVLLEMARKIEENALELIGLISAEAGRTIPDCVAEIREAVDFCRYYAEQSQNHIAHSPQGVFLCISPWNFPLAIFVGQIAAALVTGNTVLAKAADPTPLIATRTTKLFHSAGVPTDVLHLLIGDGPLIGDTLLTDSRLSGVAFTGSTTVARVIAQKLAEREGPSLPFIAETGGQNCMVVDSTALPEQIVDDVISSAFHSAGQRCSALRVLYLQDCIADQVLHMLKGAMSVLHVGDPAKISSEIGPIINETAKAKLDEHLLKLLPDCRQHFSAPLADDCVDGIYLAPTVVEINSLSQLSGEVFGPILHVVRYHMKDLSKVINEINETGYGLTFGVHSRIDAFATHLFENTIAGMVGVNPFGGSGLSGTGPKAGGPNYLHRFVQPTKSGNKQRTGTAIKILQNSSIEVMPGPTGELNELSLSPLGDILVALDEQTPLQELSHICNIALATGNSLTLTIRNMANKAQQQALLQNIDQRFHYKIRVNEENVIARVSNKQHQGILIHSSHPDLEQFRTRVALRDGGIIPMIEFDETCLLEENLGWLTSYLTRERTKTENLVAKGGNTQLFNLGST